MCSTDLPLGKPRVFLADDHQLLLDALAIMLEPICQIVGKAADGRALLQHVFAANPHIVLMDITMPLLNGLDACREIKRQLPRISVILLTSHEEESLVLEALKAGASGYVLKHEASSQLVEAIMRVMSGETYVSASIAGSVLLSMGANQNFTDETIELTGRQREIVQLIAEGRSMKEIAYLLNVAVSTVADHKYSAMQALQIKNNAELIKYAISRGMISAACDLESLTGRN
jgi:DNA-binding NarL/FixJ family response regulator